MTGVMENWSTDRAGCRRHSRTPSLRHSPVRGFGFSRAIGSCTFGSNSFTGNLFNRNRDFVFCRMTLSH